MAVEVTCPACGKVGRVPDEAEGRAIKCPKCGNSFGVSSSTTDGMDAASTPPPLPKVEPPPPPMAEWHYSRDGERHGPVTLKELHLLATSGGLRPDDLVWRAGMSDWQPASSVGGLTFAVNAVVRRDSEPETEQVILEARGVKVTTARFIIPGQTYVVSNITSVSCVKDERGPTVDLLIIGILIGIVVAIGSAIAYIYSSKAMCIPLSCLGGGITYACWKFWKGILPEYAVVLTTAATEQQAFVSGDGEFVLEIVEALNKAIAARR